MTKRKYYIWAYCGRCNHGDHQVVELESGSKKDQEALCAEFCQTMLTNVTDSGWNELPSPDPTPEDLTTS